MKIAILGATGRAGSEIAAELALGEGGDVTFAPSSVSAHSCRDCPGVNATALSATTPAGADGPVERIPLPSRAPFRTRGCAVGYRMTARWA